MVLLNSVILDDMSCRIDDLEKNIADLMTQAGVEELEGGENKAATTKTSCELDSEMILQWACGLNTVG